MDLNSQFKALDHEHHLNPYPSLGERKKILMDIKKALQTEAYSIAEAINKDFIHRSVEETLFLEIFPTINAINYCLKKMKRWMRKRHKEVSWLFFPASAYVVPQPLGVIGNLVPWNYPVYLSVVPAVYALAAGNRVMIKMSELSAETGLVLQSIFHSTGLDKYIQVVNGDVETSKKFSSLPFAHLMFTGSTAVGKLIMKTASERLTPITLELGGKSPAVLSSTMNKNYFNRLFMGKLFNAAQTCIAPDYLLVPEGWEEVVEEAFEQFIEKHYPDLMNNDNYSNIINDTHKLRLLALVEDARSKGARVVEFGKQNEHSNRLPVYLLFDVTAKMRVMQEEIFGPILPVVSYNTFMDAIAFINALPNPLALYYFGEDNVEKQFIQTRTLSGALTINDTLMHIAIDDLPFGGVGPSGMGQYHGQEGFDTFSKLKPVLIKGAFSPGTLLYPPYGTLMRLFLAYIAGIKRRGTK
ncbi:coniferyl aldehyde dehydrogenase [Legionella bononiensis]|uniref:Aldehyde dehydrogenase n=1 Tax=Legionella bononiensis TaxID=2793102 RepID=A0ABS1WBL6_9GAMM|nr:coniferyl aldehyde dehydrogenase [Legionella bononiensis]MBL7480957.1 coniferyl aldehyde dehydrogenase [Legionella bononiensis]MBL7526665.1 coniferyl aldehyde dehydrogenase [Legionella bononiensis]MBL7564072.1 coniferyl aldehyde dehydrogenase [Legionella bononiensis]